MPLVTPTACRRLLRLCVAALCFITGLAQAADPTAEQQYWLELTNRFRADPQGELSKLVNFSSPGVWAPLKSNDPYVVNALNYFGTDAATLAAQFASLTSAPALAWNGNLNVSATNYSDLMVSLDQQAHTLDGLSIPQRIVAGGYGSNWLKAGENLFAATQNITHGHSGMVIDWGDEDGNGSAPFGTGIQNPAGHRIALLDRQFKEMGIGFQSTIIPGGNLNATGPYVVTQHLGSRYRLDTGTYYSDAILTGSVYQDTIAADAFYTPGEGLAGVAVNVYDDLTNTLLVSGFTNSAGGYNLSLQGLTTGITYRVEAASTGLAAQTFTLSSTIANFGAPVVMFDNVYASFQTVPEPGSGLLCLVAGLLACSARRRPVGSQICRRGAEGQRTQRFVSSKNSATSAPLPLCGEALPE